MVQKELVVVAGVYGAGKSTLIRRKLKPFYQDQFVYILPDEVVANSNFATGTPTFHYQIFDPLIREQFQQGVSVIYETTLTSLDDRVEQPGDEVGLEDFLDQMPSDLERMAFAKEHGYHINLVYLGLPHPQNHAERVQERRGKIGTPLIEYKYIRNRFRKSWRNLSKAVDSADQSYIIDNADKDFSVVCKIDDGHIVYWNQPLPAMTTALKHLSKQPFPERLTFSTSLEQAIGIDERPDLN